MQCRHLLSILIDNENQRNDRHQNHEQMVDGGTIISAVLTTTEMVTISGVAMTIEVTNEMDHHQHLQADEEQIKDIERITEIMKLTFN